MTTEKRLTQILARQLGFADADVKLDSHLVNDLYADSIDLVECVMAIEDEFAIEVPDERAEEFSTVQSMLTYLGTRSLDQNFRN